MLVIASSSETLNLPYYVTRSLLRMALAYLLVLILGLAYGVTAGLYTRAGRIIMIPIIDVLQAIPILGYLPFLLILFTGLFPGELGLELTAILLISTSMAWAVVFGVIGGVRSIPKDLNEAARSFNLTRVKYLRHLVLPAIYPELVSGSMIAWGGGWYFLVAAEFITFGQANYPLPGLGSYIALSASEGRVLTALFGLTVLVLIVVTINRFIWRPLIERTDIYKIESVAVSLGGSGYRYHESRTLKALKKGFLSPISMISYFMKREKAQMTVMVKMLHLPYRSDDYRLHAARKTFNKYILWLAYIPIGLSILLAVVVVIPSIVNISNFQFPNIAESFRLHPEAYLLPYFAALSLLRIGAAYFIALAWTLIAGILVAKSRTLSNLFLPIFDVGQSVPALALFPFMVVLIISSTGGARWSIELSSILLLLTGMQWYLFFNIVGAVKSIPGDILEAAHAFGVKGLKLYRHVMIPSIFPGIIVGSIQAVGGGWNALIIAEYVKFGGQIYQVPGLGYFLDAASGATGAWVDPTLVIITLGVMASTVLVMNRLIWRRMMIKAEKFKFEG